MARRARPLERLTVRLRGLPIWRLDAIAYAIWIEGGRSESTRPQRGDAIRELLLPPSKWLRPWPDVEVRLHRCTKCGDVFGAPWCVAHGESYLEPVDPSLSENDK